MDNEMLVNNLTIKTQPKQNYHFRYIDEKPHGVITGQPNLPTTLQEYEAEETFPEIKLRLPNAANLDDQGNKRIFHVLVSLHRYWNGRAVSLSPHLLRKRDPVQQDFIFEEMKDENELERYWKLESYVIVRAKELQRRNWLIQKREQYQNLQLPLEFKRLRGSLTIEDNASVKESAALNVCLGFTIFEKHNKDNTFTLYKETIYSDNIYCGDDLRIHRLCNPKGPIKGGKKITVLINFPSGYTYNIRMFNNEIGWEAIVNIDPNDIFGTSITFDLPKGPYVENAREIPVRLEVMVDRSSYKSKSVQFRYFNDFDDDEGGKRKRKCTQNVTAINPNDMHFNVIPNQELAFNNNNNNNNRNVAEIQSNMVENPTTSSAANASVVQLVAASAEGPIEYIILPNDMQLNINEHQQYTLGIAMNPNDMQVFTNPNQNLFPAISEQPAIFAEQRPISAILSNEIYNMQPTTSAAAAADSDVIGLDPDYVLLQPSTSATVAAAATTCDVIDFDSEYISYDRIGSENREDKTQFTTDDEYISDHRISSEKTEVKTQLTTDYNQMGIEKAITSILNRPENDENISIKGLYMENGNTIFHEAILDESNLRTLHKLMKTTKHTKLVLKARNDLRQNLLHFACIHHKSNCIRPLVGMGCALDEQDRQGRTPLHIAIERNDNKCILEFQDLLNDGYKKYPKEVATQLIQMLKVYSNRGHSVLHAAVLENCLDLVKTLLKFCKSHQIDVTEYEVLGSGDSIVHLMAKRNWIDMIELMREYIPNYLTIEDYAGKTISDMPDLTCEMFKALKITET